jgi:hypothetical protein
MTQIRECLPDTGLQMPVAEEALQLYRIVRAACPWINDHTEQDFAHGVLAVGLMFTRAQPRSDVAFSWHLQNANDLLRKHFDVLPITGPALLAAVLAHRVPWRRYDPSIGELTELALDPYFGLRCKNEWRSLLAGANLLPPAPPRERFRVEPSRVIFLQAGNEREFWR